MRLVLVFAVVAGLALATKSGSSNAFTSDDDDDITLLTTITSTITIPYSVAKESATSDDSISYTTVTSTITIPYSGYEPITEPDTIYTTVTSTVIAPYVSPSQPVRPDSPPVLHNADPDYEKLITLVLEIFFPFLNQTEVFNSVSDAVIYWESKDKAFQMVRIQAPLILCAVLATDRELHDLGVTAEFKRGLLNLREKFRDEVPWGVVKNYVEDGLWEFVWNPPKTLIVSEHSRDERRPAALPQRSRPLMYEDGYDKLLEAVIRAIYTSMSSAEITVTMNAALKEQATESFGEQVSEIQMILFSAAVVLDNSEIPQDISKRAKKALKTTRERFTETKPWAIVEDYVWDKLSEYIDTGLRTLYPSSRSPYLGSMQARDLMNAPFQSGYVDDVPGCNGTTTDSTSTSYDSDCEEAKESNQALPTANAKRQLGNSPRPNIVDKPDLRNTIHSRRNSKKRAVASRNLKYVLQDFAACMRDDECIIEDEDLVKGLNSKEERSAQRKSQQELEQLIIALMEDRQ